MLVPLSADGLNTYFAKFRDLKMVVIGDVMLDQYLRGAVRRISPEAPIPVVSVESDASRPGGAANVAMNLVQLGAQCALIGLTGDDLHRRKLLECLRANGLDTRGLVADPRGTTIVKTRILAHQQQLLRIDHEAPAAGVPARHPSKLEKKLVTHARRAMAGAHAVVFSDYVKGCLTPYVIRAIVAHARRLRIPVLVDSKDNHVEKYRGVDWIKPNRHEAAKVVGFNLDTEADFARAVEIFFQRAGCRVVAITRSSKGMSIFEQSVARGRGRGRNAKPVRTRRIDCPTHAREVFDVTGGGDTALAIMALMAAIHAPLEDTIQLANLASGVTVGHVGTYAPSAQDILELFAEHTVSHESSKLLTADQAAARLKTDRAQGRKVAFTNGCFDIFHAGHVQTLQFARAQADLLIVGINSDESVRRQGKAPDRPLVDQFARAMVLASLKCVDQVIIYDEDTPIPLLKLLKPDVLVKGGDYTKQQVVGWQLVEKYGGRVVVAPLVDGLSTTTLVKRIRAATPSTHA